MEKLFEELFDLLEEYINEVSVKRWKEAALNSIDSREGNRLDHAKEVASLPNSKRNANDIVKAAKNSAEERESKRRKEYKRKQVSVPFGYRDVPDDNTRRNTKRTDKAYELATTNNKNAKELYGDYVDEALSLVEEFINELDDETVDNARNKRANNVEKAMHNFLKARDEGTPEEAEKAKQEWDKAGDKLVNIDKLRNLRGARKEEARKALAKFKEKLLNRKPQTAKETQQAASDHANAMIDQHYRQKLEKTFSNECFESLISLIEGELIDFQQKRKEKVLDRNAHKMAEMMQDGSLNAVRVLPNKELIGDPVAIKKVKEIQKENAEVIGKCRKHG